MSIKSFHLAFISVSFLLFLFVAQFAFSELSGWMQYGLGGASAVLAVGIVFYGRLFLQKIKEMEAAQ